jgi:hypothetical protein
VHISKTLVRGLVLSLIAVCAAHAQGTVQARSDVPAEVVLNGQLMGVTPIDIASLQPGIHEIRLHAIGRDEHKTYSISVPVGVASQSHIQGSFGAVYVPPVVVQPVVVRPVVIRPRGYIAPAHAVVIVKNRGGKRNFRRGRRF